ncbi:hypothetical protein Bbelb_030150 [Branchiostoma belcheri]|nr:hypothetical protein Bbelb_030150 [Branchiostoma belcheri]
MKTTTMLMTCRWVLLLVVLERTVLEAAPAGRVTRSEEDAPTSTSARQAARRRHNCMADVIFSVSYASYSAEGRFCRRGSFATERRFRAPGGKTVPPRNNSRRSPKKMTTPANKRTDENQMRAGDWSCVSSGDGRCPYYTYYTYRLKPPWSRQCQTSDLIIFKRSLKEQDLLRTAAVSSGSNNRAAAVSSEADSTNSAVESKCSISALEYTRITGSGAQGRHGDSLCLYGRSNRSGGNTGIPSPAFYNINAALRFPKK